MSDARDGEPSGRVTNTRSAGARSKMRWWMWTAVALITAWTVRDIVEMIVRW